MGIGFGMVKACWKIPSSFLFSSLSQPRASSLWNWSQTQYQNSPKSIPLGSHHLNPIKTRYLHSSLAILPLVKPRTCQTPLALDHRTSLQSSVSHRSGPIQSLRTQNSLVPRYQKHLSLSYFGWTVVIGSSWTWLG